jgi:hypothetical protein
MADVISVPYGNVQVCYDIIQEETPGLWHAFQEQLLATANEAESAEVRIAQVVDRQKDVWQQFLDRDSEGKSMVVLGSWVCCIGDLAEALLDAAIVEITTSTDTVARKRERLEALLALVRQDLAEAPNSPSMTLALHAALLGLA